MADKYLPALADFAFEDNEEILVTKALSTDDPWGWKPIDKQEQSIIKEIKNKIRDYHLERQGQQCCYCRINLCGAGPYMTDREHILPKSKDEYRHLSYTLWNLSIACKRCNMGYKKSKIDFVVDPNDSSSLKDSENYHFIHPNFDLYSEHLSRCSYQNDEIVLVKYTVKNESSKGQYTYDYFGLRELEVGSCDHAQGLKAKDNLSESAEEVRVLAIKMGQ